MVRIHILLYAFDGLSKQPRFPLYMVKLGPRWFHLLIRVPFNTLLYDWVQNQHPPKFCFLKYKALFCVSA